MKKPALSLLSLLFCSLPLTAQRGGTDNTIPIAPTDTEAEILAKAVRVVPTKNQLRALENEFIAFIHFGPNTFTRREWGTGMEDPKVFDLRTLDTDQWVRSMQAAGMKMVLITAKHHDGFVLWQSRYTRHGVMSSPFEGGRGDIVRNLSESCRKYGMKLGIYLSPADLYQIENPEGLYGNLSQKTLRTIPREVEGRPFADKRRFQFVVDDYNEYFLNQLFELLTEYGPISEVWFDGAHPKRKGGQTYNYPAWRELIHALAPEAVIFGREDVRWCGNEAGGTRDTEWNVITYPADPDTMTVFPDRTLADLGSREVLRQGGFLHYQQAETNTSIREGWFYRDDDRQGIRTADDVFDIYERSVGGNSTFLLNIPPNREGRFSPTDVKVLEETGRRIRETYGTNLMAGAKGVKRLVDGKLSTAVKMDGPMVVTLPEARTINRIVVQEPIATRGERIEEHAVDAWVDGGWREVVRATNVGYKRILRFADVKTDRLRLRVTASRATPYIATFTAHHYAARAPRLEANRDAQGLVTLGTAKGDFGWRSHGQDAAANLNAGMAIHYTIDGTEPTSASPVYREPFYMERGTVKAVAVVNGEAGEVLESRYGLPKAQWRTVGASSAADGHAAEQAFDNNPATYWQSTAEIAPVLTIDLGREVTLAGMAYMPQTAHAEGMVARGRVSVSVDGTTWTDAGAFEFDNLVNDPSRRFFDFAQPHAARFVRITATEMAAGSKVAAIAEIDLY